MMRRNLKNILRVLQPHERRTLLLQAVADVIVTVFDLAFLAALLYLINFYLHQNAEPPRMAFLHQYPKMVFGIFCLAFALKNRMGYRLMHWQHDFVYRVAARLSQQNLDDYLRSEYDHFVQVDSSVHLRRISYQPTEFGHYIVKGLQQVISQSILVFITAVLIVLYDPVLFLKLFLILLPPLLFTAWLLKKRTAVLRTGAREAGESALQYLKEALSGFVESRIYFKKDFFINRYMKGQRALHRFLAGQQSLAGLPARLMEVFAVAGLYFLLVFSGGQISFLSLGAFLAAAYKIIPGTVKIMNGFGQLHLYEFVVNDLLQSSKGANVAEEKTGVRINSIELVNIHFAYGDKHVLRDLSFCLEPGDLAGVSGISGKGKTTLIHLLLGFIPPQNGAVLVNGQQLEMHSRQPLWQRVAYVKQQPFFIHDSLAQNVALSTETADPARLQDVLQRAGLPAWMQEDESRLVRENGRNLSGGQRQRVALARALYKDFDLLILDEPFSEMDEAAGEKMMDGLKELCARGKMVLLITHQPDSLRYCTKIIDLDN